MRVIKTQGLHTLSAVAAGAFMLGAGAQPAAADTVIRWLHIEPVVAYVDLWKTLAGEFEKANPGVKIEFQFLENQAFKAKLPTLLQSSEAPSFFYSWGGGVLQAQAETGTLRPLNAALDANGGAWRNAISSATVDGLSYNGQVWAAPYKTGMVSFFYNKELFAKASVDATKIKSWTDFLAAVKTLKAAGITPISGGGGDKWPLHFYWSYLAMREAGHQGFADAKAGKGDGFAGAPFVKAGEHLAALGKLEPFQRGYQGATWNDALAAFGDGRAAILLGFENTNFTQATSATNGKGQPDANIGRFPFPTIDGAPGLTTDYLGRLNGWAVTKNAPKETEAFLQYLSSADVQRRLATTTGIIPIAKGANDGVKNAILKDSAVALESETWHQNFLDQDLGPSVGSVVNDMTIEIVTGNLSPADAAQQIQDAFLLQAK